MHDSALCLEIENLECRNFEGPANHGSSTTVKVFGVLLGGEGNVRSGWNVRRNEASELRCLTVNDIFAISVHVVVEGVAFVDIVERLKVIVRRSAKAS